MSGFITTLSVVNTLLTALNCPILKDSWSNLTYKSKLNKLKKTVTTIKSLLFDAEKKLDSELSQIDVNYIQELKDVIYDADDLFDEIVTHAKLNQHFKGGVTIAKKVRKFYKHFEIARQVKKIRESLDAIADDRAKFGLGIGTQPHRRTREETFSYVCAPTVVGRDDDATKVIGMLLDYTTRVNFLTIVGIGGVGKTTLAKLVFGDERIQSVFDLRLWVCVSDQDGASLDEKDILVKILELLNCNRDSSSSIESLQGEYKQRVEGRRFLLVLDDVWNESVLKLNNLKELLMIDGNTSRIIATTRSMKMARIVGGGIHELKGLSDDNSRHLFEMVAFGNGSKPIEFNNIVEKIVEICYNIPLVIKVIGSLLYGQSIGKWQTFVTSGFAEFAKEENDIMSILKLSYDHLDPSLKSCFAYCAIFPKDYRILKEEIMNLWEAQGYIVPFGEGQSIENVGEEHFSILLQRCFFQDVTNDEFGEVESFKVHDLIHDLAQRVSRKEIRVVNSNIPDLEYSVRHLFVYNLPLQSSLINSDEYSVKSKIRSYLHTSWHDDFGDKLPTFGMLEWRCLRALALQSIDVVPVAIGNLLHLRYLNLANSNIRTLPNSIVNLHNLHTLNLNHCKFLEEWPKEFNKLVNLTHLYLESCFKLSCMPVGMSKLSRIHTMTQFVVEDESASGMQRVGQLVDLQALAMNLKNRLSIQFKRNYKSTEGYEWDGSCLEAAKYLNKVSVSFCFSPVLESQGQPEDVKGGKEEVVIEKLKPHPNLKKFSLSDYAGKKIAGWGRAQDNWAILLPNLVHIELNQCHRLQELPMLSKLQHLKSLSLNYLSNLEYIEEQVTSNNSGSESLDTTFFPALESFNIKKLVNLKRWCSNESHRQPAFTNLSELTISHCPRLISFPPCLSRPRVDMKINNKRLRIVTADGGHISDIIDAS